MMAVLAFRRRAMSALLAGMLLAGLGLSSLAAAHAEEVRGGSPAVAADPPVIEAPADPGRWAPSPGYAPTELGGVNSLAATDAPPMTSLGLAEGVPVVVEMFTSQGCGSCIPSDTMLAMLADEPDVLPLSYHVDYWDYLGWPDSFARPEFSERQERYARAAGEHAVYTPQVIVGGSDTALSLGPAQLMGLIDARRLAPALVSVQRKPAPDGKGQLITLTPLSDLGGPVQVLLVRFAPWRTVEVAGGENHGKRVTYANVVLSLDMLARWNGAAALNVTVRAGGLTDDRFPADTRHAVLVQRELGRKGLPGPILAAVRLD